MRISLALILSGLAALLLSYSHYLYVFESSIKAIAATPGSNVTMPELPLPLYVACFVMGVAMILLGCFVERGSIASRLATGGHAVGAEQSPT